MAPSTRTRRLCSFDMAEVPPECYWLDDPRGGVYFCNARCLCLWSIQFATKPNLPEDRKRLECDLVLPGGARHHFSELVDLARWSAANVLGPPEPTPNLPS